MRILLLSTGGHIGGEETFTRNLAKALIERGHDVIAVAGGPVQIKDLNEEDIPIAKIDITKRSALGLMKGAIRLQRYIEDTKPEIIHCQAAGPAIMGGIIRKLGLGKGEKWVYHDHGINQNTYKWLPFFLNSLDLTITCSDLEMIRLKANGVKDESIVRIHSGIVPGDYSFSDEMKRDLRRRYRTEFGIQKEDFLLGYIGRLSPEKGCDLLIPAIKLVLENINQGLRLLVVGDGILRNKLQKESLAFELDKDVIFTGFRTDIPGILTCMDTLVLPSYIETFSLTTLQAMGSGIPVIASDTGGNPEQIIDNFNGLLFETGKTDSLASKIRQMIDRKDRDIMGHNGYLLVEKYLNASRMVDEIEYQYKKVSKQ